MADFRRGIKAGVAVAAAYLIVSVIFEVTGFFDQFGDITWQPDSESNSSYWIPHL